MISKRQFLYVLSGITIIVVLNSLLIFFEKQDESSALINFENVIWYMVVTLTTVGYGDMSPVTTGGKIIGYIYVFSSLGILGYLFTTVSNKIYTMLEEKKLGFAGTEFEDHIIFLGWNEFTEMVADQVTDANRKLAIVTNQKDQVDLIYDHYGKKEVFVLFSDRLGEEAYERLNMSKSCVVFIAREDDAGALMDVVNLKKDYPNVDIVVSLQNSNLKQTFIAAGVTYVIARNEIASKLVASYIFEPDVADLNIELISSAGAKTDFDILEYEVVPNNPYINKDGHTIFHSLKDEHDVVLMGISKLENNQHKLIANPSEETLLCEGDYIVVMTTGAGNDKLQEVFGVNQGRLRSA